MQEEVVDMVKAKVDIIKIEITNSEEIKEM